MPDDTETPLVAVEDLLNTPPYALSKEAKGQLYLEQLNALTRFHASHCAAYEKMVALLGNNSAAANAVEDIPFIPVRMFKTHQLMSIAPQEVVKTMTSSGTSGQAVSHIYLDKQGALLQTKVLAKIVASFIGPKRLPMLIVDAPSTLKDRSKFSARGAGILGFSMFGHDVQYALDDAMQLDLDTLRSFLDKHASEDILVFGFTAIVWEYLYEALAASGMRLPMERCILIHGGGWKKLADRAVDSAVFRQQLQRVTGISRIHNYYGMVEQTGSIFMECAHGHMHASIFSDIVVRDHRDFKPLAFGQSGLIQLVSLLPRSYPGHSLLTEDVGRVIGEDDCPCGRLGKYFVVTGRVAHAELRGCSDVQPTRAR